MDVQGGWLPVPVTVLIGRADALRQACELLEGARLVTVVGPGGVGKTRLAVEAASAVAAAYEKAGFVDGARLRRPEQLLPAVAASIGLRDAGSQPLGKTVRAYLRERAVLLVADNLEHLLPDAALTIAELLADGPRLRILATSRAPGAAAQLRGAGRRPAAGPGADPRVHDRARPGRRGRGTGPGHRREAHSFAPLLVDRRGTAAGRRFAHAAGWQQTKCSPPRGDRAVHKRRGRLAHARRVHRCGGMS